MTPRDANIILRWLEPLGEGVTVSWQIRGIHSDGAFYGEVVVRRPAGGGGASNLEGSLSPADFAEVRRLVTMIEEYPRPDPAGAPFNGLVARGKYSAPEIVYRHTHPDSEAGTRFCELLAVVRPYGEEALRSALKAAQPVPY